jgi:hypothetical protein
MTVQIVQLDAETPIINSGHPTLWASAPKQWSPVTEEEMGEIVRDGGDLDGDGDCQWTEDNIQQAWD